MKAPSIAGIVIVVLATVLASRVASAQPPEAVGAEEVAFTSGKLTLRGFIYKPDGPDPAPVVVWNHGSEQRPGWLPTLGPMFRTPGYALFIPHRRGQGRSPGEYIIDVLRRERER